ncbi:hypothetical protein EXIGLDRAFT_835149 [Exidia glandulosa HHB12029]|uniref:Uncharacterized protein n=1 Tax=Exidia glandulosa HHB12029 TaxID=1314781 RepID=A0A165J126_EXIGL|nr:hypothetical protein EXIGLDRAFT_835149 [Exidia glandulosa HHB12029]
MHVEIHCDTLRAQDVLALHCGSAATLTCTTGLSSVSRRACSLVQEPYLAVSQVSYLNLLARPFRIVNGKDKPAFDAFCLGLRSSTERSRQQLFFHTLPVTRNDPHQSRYTCRILWRLAADLSSLRSCVTLLISVLEASPSLRSAESTVQQRHTKYPAASRWTCRPWLAFASDGQSALDAARRAAARDAVPAWDAAWHTDLDSSEWLSVLLLSFTLHAGGRLLVRRLVTIRFRPPPGPSPPLRTPSGYETTWCGSGSTSSAALDTRRTTRRAASHGCSADAARCRVSLHTTAAARRTACASSDFGHSSGLVYPATADGESRSVSPQAPSFVPRTTGRPGGSAIRITNPYNAPIQLPSKENGTPTSTPVETTNRP